MNAQLAGLLAATLADVDRLSHALAAAHRRAATAEQALRAVGPAPSPAAVAAIVAHADARARTAESRAARVLDALAHAIRAEDDAMARRHTLDVAVRTKRQAPCDEEDVDELLLETVAPPPRPHNHPPAKRARLSPARPSPPTTTSPSPPARLSPSAAATLPPANPRRCHACNLPGRYKDGKCIEKWGPGPHGPGTVCDRCRKKIKRVERREIGANSSSLSVGAHKSIGGLTAQSSRDSLVVTAQSSVGRISPQNSLPLDRAHPHPTSTSTSPHLKHEHEHDSEPAHSHSAHHPFPPPASQLHVPRSPPAVSLPAVVKTEA